MADGKEILATVESFKDKKSTDCAETDMSLVKILRNV